jgi:MIP family channel proteins
MKINKNISTLIAEVIGTFALVLFGCSAIVVDSLYNGVVGHVGIALVFGLIVMAMIYSVGNISGANLNPAVTIGFVAAGRMKIKKAVLYITAQFVGAILAALVIKAAFPSSLILGETLPSVHLISAFIIETVLTFFLMFVILNVSTGHMEKGIMAGVAIGGTVALEAIVGGPLTGASMNPARSLGPALVNLNLTHLWIYIAAPILGALLASPLCRVIQGPECCYVEEDGKMKKAC